MARMPSLEKRTCQKEIANKKLEIAAICHVKIIFASLYNPNTVSTPAIAERNLSDHEES